MGALLMSLELNKNTLAPKRSPNVLLSLKLLSLTNDWPRLMRLLPRVDVLPWPSLNLASGNWKLNLAAAKARLVKPSKDSRRLNVASRSFNSNKMRITRTKIACLSWLANFNKRSRPTRSRLRRLKRSLPSTWPNTARLNKNSRKPKKGPKWLEINSLWPVLLPLACKEYARIKKDFAHPKSSSSKQQRIPSPPIQTPEIRSNQQQLQGHNQNRKCITKHHQFIYHPFLSCLNMKYIACK